MATFRFDDMEFQVGLDGVIIMSPLSTQEWNEYQNELARESQKPEAERDYVAVDARLFDRKVKEVRNLDAVKDRKVQAITLDSLELIPPHVKSRVVFDAYKEAVLISEKKSSRISAPGGNGRESRSAKKRAASARR